MIEFNPRLFAPLYWHLIPALKDPKIRYVFIEGGSSASKTYTICQALLVSMMEMNCSTMVFRRYHVHLKDSVYSSFKSAASRLELKETYYRFNEDLIRSKINEAHVRFRGLDDEENIKGIEGYNFIYNNEWSQFTEDQWSQERKRLRGRPNQKFICDWNPISAKLWQYENWIDLDTWIDQSLDTKAPTKYSSLNSDFAFKRINTKGDSLWIKVTFRDNYWIVGHPSGKGGYVDQATLDDFELDRIRKPNFYRIYANGERGILRTGGEFWKQFNEMKHVKPLKVEKGTIHVSLDENVNPYVTVGTWQVLQKNIRQVHEIPAKEPNNNAPKAADLLIQWLRSIEYKDIVFIYGDPSASKRSTVDENNASFYDKFIERLQNAGFMVINRVRKSAPEVALSAAFVNEIYEFGYDGWTITIGDNCKVSIDDYISVKEDKDGSMFKPKIKDPNTGVTYEPVGHFSDQKRYFIITLLDTEFKAFMSRAKKIRIFS